MSCYINITPSDLFEATPSGKSAHTRSLDGLVSWLLTTTITILGSNHTESSTTIDAPPDHASSDVLLAASAPLAYQLVPRWLTSPKGPIYLQDI